jgi:hypothetical protein
MNTGVQSDVDASLFWVQSCGRYNAVPSPACTSAPHAPGGGMRMHEAALLPLQVAEDGLLCFI